MLLMVSDSFEKLSRPVRQLAHFIGYVLTAPHSEGYHSDHPFDRPPQMWVDPPTQEFQQGELIHLLYDDAITQAYLESK